MSITEIQAAIEACEREVAALRASRDRVWVVDLQRERATAAQAALRRQAEESLRLRAQIERWPQQRLDRALRGLVPCACCEGRGFVLAGERPSVDMPHAQGVQLGEEDSP